MGWVLISLLLGSPRLDGEPPANELHVAVASNFASAMTALVEEFESSTGHDVVLIFGSTGKLYAQIRNGAPFDAFFAADDRRPRLLEEDGIAVAGSRFTYALGRLVLWSPDPGLVDTTGEVLRTGVFRFLAIANPRLAPYGRAAKEVLDSLALWDGLAGRIVRGENIAQTYQFVATRNADLGFVALSQLGSATDESRGSSWHIPVSLYSPIVQDAVLVRDSEPGRAFMRFVKSEAARKIIRSNGYDHAQ